MSDEGRLVTLEQGQARQRECLRELRAKAEDHERRIAELEASLPEARAHIRASNMQKPRAVRE